MLMLMIHGPERNHKLWMGFNQPINQPINQPPLLYTGFRRTDVSKLHDFLKIFKYILDLENTSDIFW